MKKCWPGGIRDMDLQICKSWTIDNNGALDRSTVAPTSLTNQ